MPALVPTRLPFAQTTLLRGMPFLVTAQRVRSLPVVADQAEWQRCLPVFQGAKILVVERERPGRTSVILVKEALGF